MATAIAQPDAASSSQPRTVSYSTLRDILNDLESLVAQGVVSSGKWTPAQNIDHVRRLMTVAREGTTMKLPLHMRLLGRLVLKRRIFTHAIPRGLKMPKAAESVFLPPADVTLEQAMADMRNEVELCSRPGAMSQPSPLVGKISHENWTQLHCRHAELHFSNLHPAGN